MQKRRQPARPFTTPSERSWASFIVSSAELLPEVTTGGGNRLRHPSLPCRRRNRGPAFQLSPPPTDTPATDHLQHWAAHVVYGGSLELVRSLLRRILCNTGPHCPTARVCDSLFMELQHRMMLRHSRTLPWLFAWSSRPGTVAPQHTRRHPTQTPPSPRCSSRRPQHHQPGQSRPSSPPAPPPSSTPPWAASPASSTTSRPP